MNKFIRMLGSNFLLSVFSCPRQLYRPDRLLQRSSWDLWSYAFSAMRRHKLTNQKIMTMVKTKPLWKHTQRATPKTFWDIWSESWESMTWQTKRRRLVKLEAKHSLFLKHASGSFKKGVSRLLQDQRHKISSPLDTPVQKNCRKRRRRR